MGLYQNRDEVIRTGCCMIHRQTSCAQSDKGSNKGPNPLLTHYSAVVSDLFN